MCSPFFVGIIVSRTRTTVRTSVFRAIEDAHLTKSTKKGVTKAILKEGELVDYVLEELITGIGSRAERMYAYAKSGAYTYGLPSGQFISGAGTTDVVIATLENLENAPVILDYVHRGPPNNLHIGWMNLIALHGYNPATNQLAGLSVEKGVPVYLNDMVVMIPGSEVNLIDPLSLQQWGIAAKAGVTPLRSNTPAVQAMILPSAVEIEAAGTTEYLRVEYIWKTAGGVVLQGSFNIPVAAPQAVYNNTLLLHFDGSNSSTNIVDVMGNTPSFTDGRLTTANSKFGGSSLICDTSGGRVAYFNAPVFSKGTLDWTIECWFNWQGSVTDRAFLFGDAGGNGGGSSVFVAKNTSGQLYGGANIGGITYITPPFNPVTNTWYHLALVRNGTDLMLFIDGNLISVVSCGVGTANEASGSFAIGGLGDYFTGGYAGSYGDRWVGCIDEFRFTKGVARYLANFPVPVQAFPDTNAVSYDNESTYFHARYTVGSVTKYWMYRDGAGTYSALDELFERPHEPGGSFFPFTYFRYNKHSEITDKTSDAFKTSKKLLKYLGMDYETVAAGVDKNPNIKDVEQAMLVFAVPANTNTPIEQRYLFDFFNNLYMSNPVDLRFASENAAKIFGSRADGLTMVSPSIVIKDTRFKMMLENAGIFKRRVAGNSGAVGSYASGEEATTRPITYVDSFTGSTVSVGATTSRHWYRHQVSKNFYDEIEVLGLRTVFHIWDQYATIGKNTDNILIIPLDHSITRNYSIPDRELLYTRSLHYVFNSRVTVFVEWYETGVFKAVLVVVAIVAIVVGLLEVGVKVLAFVIAGDYAAAAVLVILTLLVQLAVVTAFKLFVKITGIRVAFVIAVVAAVLGVADIVNSGSLAGAPFAQDLLTLSTNLAKASSRQTLEDTQDLLGEAKTFSIFTEEKNKELETAKKLLSNSNALNPFVIFGEAPQDFYNRTVHSGNIGTVAIDAVSSYVDMALTLPKLKDSLGIKGY